jgi:S1-C subfamily serine protease
MRLLTAILALLAAANDSEGKTKPKPLSERYDKLSCAVVQITQDQGGGTGFFISADGDLVTAAHVAINRAFSEPEPGNLKIDVDYKPGLRIRRKGNGEAMALQRLPKLSRVDNKRAMSDLVILRTGIKTPCFLKIGHHAEDFAIGQHLIAIGYPESAPGGALYEGPVSARYKHLPLPFTIVNGKPLYPEYDVLRIQMPVTSGASGGPVIADDDDVIGIITENPGVWFNDLNNLIAYGQEVDGGFNAPVSDLSKMLAKLAWVVHEFVTSGAVLAVPVSYLEAQEPREPRQQRPHGQKPLNADDVTAAPKPEPVSGGIFSPDIEQPAVPAGPQAEESDPGNPIERR